jgi:hypothetical protein
VRDKTQASFIKVEKEDVHMQIRLETAGAVDPLDFVRPPPAIV